jgi:hypothetical protein
MATETSNVTWVPSNSESAEMMGELQMVMQVRDSSGTHLA